MAAPKLENDFAGLLSYCAGVKISLSALFRSVPNTFSFTADGGQLMFLSTAKSPSGNSLYTVPVEGGEWQQVEEPEKQRQLTRSEQLLRERMRETSSGITNYTYLPASDSVLVNTGSACRLIEKRDQVLEYPSLPGALDYKLCPRDHTLLACCHKGELWLLDASSQSIHQLTHAADSSPGRKVTAGQSSFILQEEFDRYTGYWWHPHSGDDGLYTILYEQVDESDVEVVHTFNPSSQSVDDYRYPRPGGANAVSILRLLQFTIDNGKPTVVHSDLLSSLRVWLAEWEYCPRIGWTSDGTSVWLILLNRSQQRTQLVTIPMAAFLTTPTATPMILSEETSDMYINMQKLSLFHPLPPTSHHPTRLIAASQSTGYHHLVLIEQASSGPPTIQPLTAGPWVVIGEQVWSSDDIVYFEANKSSPLDRHLYAIKISSEQSLPVTDPVQLTPSGYYHKCVVCPDKGLFVSSSSSLSSAPSVTLYRVTPSSLAVEILFTVWPSVDLPLTYTPPIQFTAQTSTGVTLHGLVHPPLGAEPGQQYPTVLYMYGGPEVQIVTSGFSRHLFRTEQWRRAGFAVVMVDNRGSANRGVEFDSAVKHRMGHVEVDDQVTGIMAAAEATGYVDTSRVAVTGWSYGGYMALMCIAQRPDVFKLAMSGAPVTDWMWYDTGYTERYLGIPPHDNDAYHQSSVIRLAPQFPNEPNRVLIVHGMTDENVLYTHTSALVDALVANGKPYQLQVYTSERHGLRSPTAANHCDATMLAFLLQHL